MLELKNPSYHEFQVNINKITKLDFFIDLFLDSCIYSHIWEYFCELLSGIILSACMVWDFVDALMIIPAAYAVL